MRGSVGLVVLSLSLATCKAEPIPPEPEARTELGDPPSLGITASRDRSMRVRGPGHTAARSGPAQSPRAASNPATAATFQSQYPTPVEAPARAIERVDEPARPAASEGHMILVEEPEETRTKPPVHRETPPAPPTAGVRAGAVDDNLQFGAFLGFLAKNARLGIPHDVRDRIVVTVTDTDGLPLANACVQVLEDDRVVLERRSYADGRALIFPRELRLLPGGETTLRVRYDRAERTTSFTAGRIHSLHVRLETARPVHSRVPLDVVFIMDTTGSMQDEIDQLESSLEEVLTQVSHMSPGPDLRLGMVLYKDRDAGAQRTEVIPLSHNTSAFRWRLEELRAGGGDDYAEDVQSGLYETMHGLRWREDGIRLAFLVGDAPPHLDYGQRYTYVHAMRDAARRGIKIAAIGASGLDLTGELVWRQLAQYTMAPFVFLTYGETGDVEGSPSAVSHHVGSNWVAERLDAIVVRMIRSELESFGPRGTRPRKDFIQASYVRDLAAPPVLRELFRRSAKQLVDYAVEGVAPQTATALLPMRAASGVPASMRHELENQLELALSRNRSFRLVEPEGDEDLTAVVRAQFRERFDEATRVSLGKHVAAQLAVVSDLSQGEDGAYELLIKLIRLETSEVLSVSLLEIDSRWGDMMITASRVP